MGGAGRGGAGPGDEALLAASAAGDAAAFAAFYDRHGAAAFLLARAILRDRAAAEGAVAAAFVRAWREAPARDPDASTPRIWLLTRVRLAAVAARGR